jgi:hypothetical protein
MIASHLAHIPPTWGRFVGPFFVSANRASLEPLMFAVTGSLPNPRRDCPEATPQGRIPLQGESGPSACLEGLEGYGGARGMERGMEKMAIALKRQQIKGFLRQFVRNDGRPC